MPKRRGPDKRRRVIAPLRGALVREGARAVRGRPRAEIDWANVEVLLSIGCTDEEVAAGVGVSVDTLKRGPNAPIYAESKGRFTALLKMSVRQSLFSMIRGQNMVLRDEKGAPVKDAKGDVVYHTVFPPWQTRLQASIFLAKNLLGMSDHPAVTTKGDKLPPGVAPGVLTIVVRNDEDETSHARSRSATGSHSHT